MKSDLSHSPVSEKINNVHYLSNQPTNIMRDTNDIIRYLKYELEKVSIENDSEGWPTGYSSDAKITIMSSPIPISDGVIQNPDCPIYYFYRTKNTLRAYFWFIIKQFKNAGFSACVQMSSYTYKQEILNIDKSIVKLCEGIQYQVDLVVSYSHNP
tara:strand:+ start:152 stop:616 length:465 start_codon:yes stop_codon:yes gene_type:complete